GDTVAVHHEAGVSGVDGPADRPGNAVVGTPDPQVVEDGVVAVDLEGNGRLADVRSADSEEHVLQSRRVGRPIVRHAVVAVLRADLHEHRRVDRSGIDEETGDVDPGNVSGGQDRVAVARCQGGHAQALYHRVSPLDPDRRVHIVDAGR